METRDVVLVLISAALHVTWNALAKDSASPTRFLLGMEGVALLLFAPVLLFGIAYPALTPEIWALALASALFHTFYAWGLGRAYAEADLGVVYPIVRSTPALVPLLAWLWLGETVSARGAGGIALVLLGLWGLGLAASGTRGGSRLGVAFAVGALLATVGYSLIDKRAMDVLGGLDAIGRAPAPVVFFALTYPPYVIGLAALVRRDARAGHGTEREVRPARWRVPAAGALATASYLLILETLRTAPVGYVVALRQASVVFGALVSVTLLGEPMDGRRALALLAVTLGVVLVSTA